MPLIEEEFIHFSADPRGEGKGGIVLSTGGVERARIKPDGTATGFAKLAGATRLTFVLIADATALATGEDFAAYTYEIGADLAGFSLTGVVAVVKTVSSSGLPSFGIRKNSTEMLSTNVTIDANETSSRTAATAAVIKSDGSQTVAAGDLIHFDCDVAGTGTAGCEMRLSWTAP